MQTKHEIGVTSGEFIINQSDEKNRVISEFKIHKTYQDMVVDMSM